MSAKKAAAKKAAGKHDPHKAGKDARRTFEHLGRVQAIAALAPQENENLTVLIATADAAFSGAHYKDSADLLRAAEHLLFASVVGAGDASHMSKELIAAIEEEYEHLRKRADEHYEEGSAAKGVDAIYAYMTKHAASAMKGGSYRRALELARGAEALAHVHAPHHQPRELATTGKKLLR